MTSSLSLAGEQGDKACLSHAATEPLRKRSSFVSSSLQKEPATTATVSSKNITASCTRVHLFYKLQSVNGGIHEWLHTCPSEME